MAKTINKIVFSSDEDILSSSLGEVTQPTDIWMRSKGVRYMRDGLYDPFIFGKTEKCLCGTTNEGRCRQCGITVYDDADYATGYAYYKMKNAFITNEKLVNLLEKFKMIGFDIPQLSKNPLVNLWSLKFEFVDTLVDKLTEAIFGSVEENPDIQKMEYDLVDSNGDTKHLIISEIEPTDSLVFIGANGLKSLSGYSFNGKSLSFIDKHVNSLMPIISPALREIKFMSIKGRVYKQLPEIHFEYKSIISMDKYLETVKANTEYSAIDIATMAYLMNLLFNLHISRSSMTGSSKASMFRKNISSRQGSSIRWNAIPDESLLVNQVKVPRSAAYHALQSQIIQSMVTEHANKEYDAYRAYMNQDPLAIDTFKKILSESKVLMCRNPTLHRNNLVQFNPVLWDDDTPAIGVNPYICKMYNLDFDGDQIAVYFITDEDEKVLLGDSLSAENVWIYDKTHDPTYLPSSTTMYGLYCATQIHQVENKREFDKFESIESAYNANEIEFDDQIILLPNKVTTYGREKISSIINTPIENLINLNPLTMKEMSKIILGLANKPDRMEIINKIREFGSEIATLVGISNLPLTDIYKNIHPEIDAILKDDALDDTVKMKKITELMPKALKRELQSLPDSNIEVLMQGSRVNPDTLKSLYTPLVRFDANGGIKIGDSTIIEGLSEEEYVNAAHNQREILEIKASSVSREGFNRTQMSLKSMPLKYNKKITGNKESYIYIPKDLAEKDQRRIKDDAPESKVPGMVAVYSALMSNESNEIFRNQVSRFTDSVTADGARIGIAYADALVESFYQAELKLKYGGLLNDFSGEDIISHSSGVPKIDDHSILIGKDRYILTKNVIPYDKVLKGEQINEGDKIAIDANLVNVAYRYSGLYTLFDFQVAGDKSEGVNNFYTRKGVSYAPFDGTISYENGCVSINDTVISRILDGVVYFYPEGYQVHYGDRISSMVLDVSALLQVCDPHYVAYIFYKELCRIGKMDWNTDLSEICLRVLINSGFSIKKSLKTEKDFGSRQIYGATKSGLKNALHHGIDPNTMETSIDLSDDNPLLKLMLRSSVENDSYIIEDED